MGLKFKVAYNTLVQMIGRIISAGVTFLITSLILRNFGLNCFGDFTKITTFIALFYMVADFGFNAVFLREVKDGEKEIASDFSNLLTLRLVWSVILIFICLAILAFLPPGNNQQGFSPLVRLGIIIFSLTILTQGLFTSANSLFQKFLKYDFSVIASSIGSLITLVLVFLLTQNKKIYSVFGNSNLLLIISSYVIAGIITFLTSCFFVKKIIKEFSLKFDFSYWRKIFLMTLPLGMTLLFNLIYFRIDTFLLTLFRPTTEVGEYGLAYRFFETVLVFPTFYMNAVYPVMLERYQLGKDIFQRFIIKNFRFLILVSLVTTILSFSLSGFFIKIVAGKIILGAVNSLQILSLSIPLFFLSSLFMWVLITVKKQGWLVIFYGLSMILNITLNLIYIPRYGYIAAAITTGITELFVVVLTGYTCLSYFFNHQEK